MATTTISLPDAEELKTWPDRELARLWAVVRDARDWFADIYFDRNTDGDAEGLSERALDQWHPLLRVIEAEMSSRGIDVPAEPPEHRHIADLDEETTT